MTRESTLPSATGARQLALLATLTLGLATPACSKPTSDNGATPTGAVTSVAASAQAPIAPGVANVASGDAGAAGAKLGNSGAAASSGTWSGTYTSSPGPFTVPDGGEWSGTKWRGDESKDGLGEGTLTLQIEGGRVSGSLEGPLGPSVVRGSVLDDDQLTASIVRKDPADRGFEGTLLGSRSANALAGTMHLSVHDARIIREAKFSLAPAGTGAGK